MTTPNEQIKPPAEPSLRYLSVCSGMEAASVAWEPLGFVPVGFSEIEPFPCAILKHRFPNTTNYGSLTEHTTWPIERGAVDLLVGGTPCQSFSVAGLRKGMSDPRGNLALTFLALADRVKPKWIVWENVPGVLSSSGGRDFGAFLGALVELGYGFAYRVLDAQHFGVPQRRRRVFVVACLGDWRAPAEVLSLSEGLCGYIEKGAKKRKGSATDAPASVDASGLQRTVGTLCADTHPGAYSGQDAYTGRIIPEAKPIVIDRAAFNQGINAQYEPHIEASETMDSLVARGPHAVGVPTPFRKSKRAQSVTDDESWVADGKANTLNNFDLGDTRTTHAVVEPTAYILDSYTSNSMKSDNPHSGCREVDATKCLDTSCLNPSCNQGGVMITQPIAIPIHDQATRHAGKHGDKQDGKGNGLGIGQPGDPMNTLTQGDKHAVAVTQPIPLDLRNATRDPEKHDEVNRQGVGVGDAGDPAHTLTKEFCHGVAQPMLYENHPNDSRVTGPHDVAPTVVTRFGTGGGNVPPVQQEPKIIKVSELRLTGKITEQDVCPTLTSGAKQGDSDPLAITFQPGNLRREAGADPSTTTTTTLKASAGDQTPHVACFKSGQGAQARSIGWSEEVSPTLPSNAGGNTAPAVIGLNPPMAVRRLTPVECERLQGFPDNWSRIPWKGKPEEQCPDGPRYKACGNSMAVPVMRWIGERIKEIDANLPK